MSFSQKPLVPTANEDGEDGLSSGSDVETESSEYSGDTEASPSSSEEYASSDEEDPQSGKILPQVGPSPSLSQRRREPPPQIPQRPRRTTQPQELPTPEPQEPNEREPALETPEETPADVPTEAPSDANRASNKELELTLLHQTLEALPKQSDEQRSYFLLFNKDDVRLSEGKPKFPEGTCFGTTYSNVRDYSCFFLWKKHPYALSFYELIDVPWKGKREMIAFIKCKQELIDCYVSTLEECSNCPTFERCDDFSSWNAFLHNKKRNEPTLAMESNGSIGDLVLVEEEGNPCKRRYQRRRCHKGCRKGEEHHPACPNRCEREKKQHHHRHCDHDERRHKKCQKGKIYFSRRRCALSTSPTGEPEYKYFICIRGGAGPHMERSLKEASESSDLNVNAYLEMDKRACSTSLCNNNRIAYGIARWCGLNICHGFENPCCDASSLSIEGPESAFFPLIVGIPSFAQFHNRTLGMSSSSSSPPSIESNSAPKTNGDDDKWLLSYNGMINGKETASSNDGKVAIEVPSEDRVVMVPVDAKSNALSFLIPAHVNSIATIETKREEIRATHATKDELGKFNRSTKGANVESPLSSFNDNGAHKRPSTLKIYDLYDIS